MTCSPGLPGNEARAQCDPASRHAAGVVEVASNAHAPRWLVALTAVKCGVAVPRTVLTTVHVPMVADRAGAAASLARPPAQVLA